MTINKPLLRLTYVSTVAKPLTDGEIKSLVDAARSKNGRLDITGILLFNGWNFLQTLEGPVDSVEAVYASIEKDPRHTGVVCIGREEADERAFADWTMAYALAGKLANPPLGTRHLWDEAKHIPQKLSQIYESFHSIGVGALV